MSGAGALNPPQAWQQFHPVSVCPRVTTVWDYGVFLVSGSSFVSTEGQQSIFC
jgi:hypothetical protein